MRQLESSFNPGATELVERLLQGREILLDQANIEEFSGMVVNEEPTTFDQAWNFTDSKIREKWWEEINK